MIKGEKTNLEMFNYFIHVNVDILIRLNVHKPRIILKCINSFNFCKLR